MPELKCPYCHSSKIAKINYGMPAHSKSLEKKLDQEKIVLSGCCVSDDDPEYLCKSCREEFSFRKNSRWFVK